jgi:hypothetical protein
MAKAVCALGCGLSILLGVACSAASATTTEGAFAWLVPAPAPAEWKHVVLSGKGAVLWYPPSLHLISSDPTAASAVNVNQAGVYLGYLNATPRQGSEALSTWAEFRLDHLRAVDSHSIHVHARGKGLRFRGGKGSCVIDDYVTEAKSHHFEEIACLVAGRTQTTVIVAAATTSKWHKVHATLERAVSAFQVR